MELYGEPQNKLYMNQFKGDFCIKSVLLFDYFENYFPSTAPSATNLRYFKLLKKRKLHSPTYVLMYAHAHYGESLFSNFQIVRPNKF